MVKKSTEAVIVSLIVVLSSLFIGSAAAKEFLCDARQDSAEQLPLLDSACPIGNGIWGNKTISASKTTIFWVQCGMMRHPLSTSKTKLLKQQVSSNVWMKKEGNNYRCLIGPYDAYAKALTDRNQLKKLPGYQDAFIRVVGHYSVTAPSNVPSAVSKSVPAKKFPAASELVKLKPVSPVKSAVVPTSKKTATTTKSSSVKSVVKSSVKGIEIRKRTQLDGIEYVVPFLGKNKVQYYMEYDNAWNRLNYQDAINTCRALNMHLASLPQWERLLNSKVMEKEKWPVYLPYWGSDSHGLFSNGKVRPLKGSSLLNVLCVR